MQYSVVNFKIVKENSDFRIDAEYYYPEFLRNEKLLKQYKVIYFDKDFVDIKFGTTPKGAHFQDSGIPFVRSQNFSNGFIDDKDLVYIKNKDHLKQIKSKLVLKDILIAAVGATIGEIGFSTITEGNTNQNIARVRVKLKNIYPEFLFAFLKSKYGQYQLGKLNTGNAQAYLNSLNISSLFTVGLTKSFQEKIQELITFSYKKIENSKSIYSQAEQLILSEIGLLDWRPKHTLAFVENFSEIQRAERFDAEYFQPKYEEIVAAVKKYKGGFDELGNLAKIKKSVEPGSEAYRESGVPFVRVGNISKLELSDNNQQFISEALYEELKKYQPRVDEILLSKDATPGIAYYLSETPQKMIVSGGILRLKVASPRILPEYLTLVLNSAIVQKQIERDSGGSVINHWRPDQVKATLIPILGDEKQKEIKQLIAESFKCRKLSKALLEIAKRGVEIAIETDEVAAQTWIAAELEKLKIKL